MRKGLIIGIMAGLLSMTAVAQGEASMIDEGKTVSFAYTLTVEGQVIESSEQSGPLEYVHGNQQLIPGLETALKGLSVGDKKKVVVGPEDAYGVIDPRGFVEFPKTNLDGEVEPQVGMVLEVSGPDGQKVPGMISKVGEETLELNFNHPLAGKELTFDVEIVSVK